MNHIESSLARIEASHEAIEKSKVLIAESGGLVSKRPEHAAVIMGCLGRMMILENLGLESYKLFKDNWSDGETPAQTTG